MKLNSKNYPKDSTSRVDTRRVFGCEVENVQMCDYPDFCDAYISRAFYEGREMTEKELDELNENREYVYQQTIKWIY